MAYLRENSGKRLGRIAIYGPSIDRLCPELGYIYGNVNVISNHANRIKSNASPEEILKVAAWTFKARNAATNYPDPISALLSAIDAQPDQTPALRRAIKAFRAAAYPDPQQALLDHQARVAAAS